MRRGRQLIALFILLLAGCGDAAPGPEPYPLAVGLRAQISMNGGWYEMEVADVEGARATLLYRWQDQVIAERTQYRGLYALSGSDGGQSFVNDIDTTEIDSLFPLAIGKEAAFEGRSYYPTGGVSGGLMVHMKVVGEDRITLADSSHAVFLIRISSLIEIEGKSREVVRTLYYAPDIGLPLKMEMTDGEKSSWWRVTSLDHPGRSRRNRLGTVMI